MRLIIIPLILILTSCTTIMGKSVKYDGFKVRVYENKLINESEGNVKVGIVNSGLKIYSLNKEETSAMYEVLHNEAKFLCGERIANLIPSYPSIARKVSPNLQVMYTYDVIYTADAILVCE